MGFFFFCSFFLELESDLELKPELELELESTAPVLLLGMPAPPGPSLACCWSMRYSDSDRDVLRGSLAKDGEAALSSVFWPLPTAVPTWAVVPLVEGPTAAEDF